MRGAEGVELALGAARKARHAAVLAQRRHVLAPAREDLVRIGLVADVPDEAVVGRVEHVVQRDRQLDGAQVRGQVPAGARDRLEHVCAQLVGQRAELRARSSARRSAGDWIDRTTRHGHRRMRACCGLSAIAAR